MFQSSIFNENSHFDYEYIFKLFFPNFDIYDTREINARRASIKCRSSLEQTYQNTRGSTLERYCDITFDM